MRIRWLIPMTLVLGLVAVPTMASVFTPGGGSVPVPYGTGWGTYGPADLWDLDHSYYYVWGLNFELPENWFITEATIEILNVDDWVVEPDDILWINLLDDPVQNPDAVGFKGTVDNWAEALYDGYNDTVNSATIGTNIALTSYTDAGFSDGHQSVAGDENWTYSFSADEIATLTTYLASASSGADATVGLGFDPDCHFFNSGIVFTVTTAPGVPPFALLAGIPLIGGLVRRARRR